ncbi:MAG: preprotein translocase subunit SecA [Candidatus Xenobia bacterium]
MEINRLREGQVSPNGTSSRSTSVEDAPQQPQDTWLPGQAPQKPVDTPPVHPSESEPPTPVQKTPADRLPGSPATIAQLDDLIHHAQTITASQPAPPARPTNDPIPVARPHAGLLARMENAMLSPFGKGDPSIGMEPTVQRINELEPAMRKLTDSQLQARTAEFKQRLANGETEDQLLPEAYAVVREASRRVTGMRPYDVQLMGAITLNNRAIAQMNTGEGKTLTAVMPAYLNALSGKGAHIITVNETLAQDQGRDMEKIFNFLGMSCGCVLEKMSPDQKRAEYAKDVTYVTNQTLGFDWLRDNMARDKSQCVLRGLHYGVVDEVDEILIDEARTPLILSDQAAPAADQYQRFSQLIDKLTPGTDYYVDNKKHSAWLSDEGQDKVQQLLGMDLYAPCNYDKLDAQVKQEQAAGHPVNVNFQSVDEAQPYIDRCKQNQVKFIVGPPGMRFAQANDVVGIQYPEASRPKIAYGKHTPAVTLESSAFNHMDLVPYLDSALKAHTLFQRDKDYMVEERPEWVALRDLTRLQLLFNRLPVTDRKELTAQALKDVQSPAGQKLQECVAGLNPMQQARLLDGDTPAEAQGFMAQTLEQPLRDKLATLSDADRNALEGDVRKALGTPTGNDPQGSIAIVDEFTGRVLDGRRYNEGLHQALEAKEGVEVQPEQKTMASITYPNLFRQYDKLAGMSGTAKSEEQEFQKLYGLSVDVIPPNRPSQRIDKPDLIFKTAEEKYSAIADQVARLYAEGQPVLIGTRSIRANLYLHQLLSERGIPHEVLNARSVKDNTEKENQIIARAGKCGQVTVATNMAGRGVDIKPDLINYKKLTNDVLNQLADAAEAVRNQAMQTRYNALTDAEKKQLEAEAKQEQPGSPEAEQAAEVALFRKRYGFDTDVSLAEADRGVGVTLNKKKEADALYLWLNANGIPVTAAEPGVAEKDLKPGVVTLIYPGASQHPPELPLDATLAPAPAPPPAGVTVGPTRPGTIFDSQKYPTGGLYVIGSERPLGPPGGSGRHPVLRLTGRRAAPLLRRGSHEKDVRLAGRQER